MRKAMFVVDSGALVAEAFHFCGLLTVVTVIAILLICGTVLSVAAVQHRKRMQWARELRRQVEG